MTLGERIIAKLEEAKQQGDLWRVQMSTAAEQVARWDAVRQVCEELLQADDTDNVQDSAE